MLGGVLLAWALGAWLVLMSVALVWGERIHLYRRSRFCAGCGYCLDGLHPLRACPECAGVRRTARPVVATPDSSPALLGVWLLPLLVAFAAWGAVSLTARLTPQEAPFVFVVVGGSALLLSATVRPLTRWLPPAAVLRMTVLGAVSMAAGVALLTMLALRQELSRDPSTLAVLAAMTFPFSGYGLAAGLATVPVEQWFRAALAQARAPGAADLA